MKKKKFIFMGVMIALLGLGAKGINSVYPLMIQRIIDNLTLREPVLMLLVLLLAAGIIITICDVLGGWMSEMFAGHMKKNMRIGILKALYRKAPHDFYSVKTSDYVSLLNQNVDTVTEKYYMTGFTIFKCLVTMFVSVASLVYIDYKLMLVVIGVTLIPLINPLLWGRILDRKNSRLSEALKIMNGGIHEYLDGYMFARLYHLKDRFLGRASKASGTVLEAEKSIAGTAAVSGGVSGILGYAGYVLIIAYGACLIQKGEIGVGALFAAIQLADNIAPPMTAFSHLVNDMLSVRGMKKELWTLMDDDGKQKEGHRGIEFDGSSLKLEHVTVNIAGRNIVEDVNLTFEHGKKYMVIGPSGAGKSTLFKLLTQIYVPSEGKVLIGNAELCDIDVRDFYEHTGIVSQDGFILDDTLENNIFLWRDHAEKDKKAAEALMGLGDILINVPWESNCINGGYGLSGGEKQRIALVRMMWQPKEILLLDEPVSALDSVNRGLFDSWVKAQNATVLHISHDMNENAMRCYDCIIYMENGKVKMMGSYEQLSQNKTFMAFVCRERDTGDK